MNESTVFHTISTEGTAGLDVQHFQTLLDDFNKSNGTKLTLKDIPDLEAPQLMKDRANLRAWRCAPGTTLTPGQQQARGRDDDENPGSSSESDTGYSDEDTDQRRTGPSQPEHLPRRQDGGHREADSHPPRSEPPPPPPRPFRTAPAVPTAQADQAPSRGQMHKTRVFNRSTRSPTTRRPTPQERSRATRADQSTMQPVQTPPERKQKKPAQARRDQRNRK